MTRESSNTTIKTHQLRLVRSLVLYLTAIRGRLLLYALKLASAESSALTAIESILLNSKVTMLQRNSSEQLGSLQHASTLRSKHPHEFINDVINGKTALKDVSMETWIQNTVMAMITQQQPHLDIEVPYGGGMYKFHHCIQTVNPPVSDVATILEDTQ